MDRAEKVIPAQLSYLAIFCPRLGTTEETFRDQVVFYYSRRSRSRRRHDPNIELTVNSRDEHPHQDEDNEKLRQIGLAQAMVDFAQNFSAGKPVESIETEKSRILIHQLEKGWWLVASIDLTRIPSGGASTNKNVSNAVIETQRQFEYSSREIAPTALLIHYIKRAQSSFSLHHGSSLDDLFSKLGRTIYCSTLSRFWTWFASDWNVLLHGNPSVDIFDGIKLAAGGELGIGVGEEEWGSGEREVLEHFAMSTNGLVDMLVARFGDEMPKQQPQESYHKTLEKSLPWVGSGKYPDASNGVIFSGIKALQAQSRHDIVEWMQSIYTHGELAYGVRVNPASERRKRRERKAQARTTSEKLPVLAQKQNSSSTDVTSSPGDISRKKKSDDRPNIPPPIVSAANASLKKATTNVNSNPSQQDSLENKGDKSGFTDPQVWMNVLTLGYGSSWTFSGKDSPLASSERAATPTEPRLKKVANKRSGEASKNTVSDLNKLSKGIEETIKLQQDREEKGYFMIGYQGNLGKDEKVFGESESSEASGDQHPAEDVQGHNGRLLLRTIYVKLNTRAVNRLQRIRLSNRLDKNEKESNETKSTTKKIRVRVVIFVHRPFIYTLLFEPDTPSLSFPAFYQDLYNYLSPLHKSLSLRTSPSRAVLRTHDQVTTQYLSPTASSLATSTPKRPIYDLVYNPTSLAIHSSLPNVPEPGSMSIDPIGERWTRVDALNVHSQILAMRIATEAAGSTSFERLAKTGRGWWVIWMRVTTTAIADLAAEDDAEDARLVGDAEEEEAVEKEREEEDAIIDCIDDDKAAARGVGERTSNEEVTPTLGKPFVAITGRASSGTKSKNSTNICTVSPSIREAVLVRRAGDHAFSGDDGRSEPSIFGFGGRRKARPDAAAAAAAGISGNGIGEGTTASRLMEGIGIDARKYVEGLLSFNR